MKPDVHYARNGDVALAYQVVGDGPSDLFLAIGYLSNLEYAWEIPSNAAFFRRLATSRRLILMDRRGSGLSDRFSAPDAPPLETLMEDVRVVLDAAGSARTSLLGLWDGCMIATLFAATYPERVTSLILFSAAPTGTATEDLPGGWDDEQWEEWLASIRTGWGTRSWTVQNLRWQCPSLLDDPEQLERWIAFSRLSASPSSAEAVLRIEKDTDIRHILPAVRVPTLVLSRSGDQAQPIEGGRYIAAKIHGARFVELPGNDAVPWVGDADTVLSEVEGFLGQSTGRGSGPERRLGTVLFTDIVGSTEHLAGMGDAAWRERLAEHDRIAKDLIERGGGDYVNTTGDGLLATFDGPAAAVRCAQAIAGALGPLGLEIRAGVHTGELEIAGDDIRGIAVHIGARVMSLAQPSEVLVSSTVKDLVAGSGLAFEDAGEHELKGVPERWRLYRVVD
ncbi:MAG TPA: adenylate/guanylate cyclase domain-containing protein [Actinomycetota bacterium]